MFRRLILRNLERGQHFRRSCLAALPSSKFDEMFLNRPGNSRTQANQINKKIIVSNKNRGRRKITFYWSLLSSFEISDFSASPAAVGCSSSAGVAPSPLASTNWKWKEKNYNQGEHFGTTKRFCIVLDKPAPSSTTRWQHGSQICFWNFYLVKKITKFLKSVSD